MRRSRLILSFLLVSALWGMLEESSGRRTAAAADVESVAQEAVVLIQGKIDRTLTIIRDKELQTPTTLPKLRRRLLDELEPIFTFREMTIRALGTHARELKPHQIDALTKSFKLLLQRVYIDQLTAHLVKSEMNYKIDDLRITGHEARGNYVKIYSKSRISKNSESSEIAMNYRMVKRDGKWMIYDIEIEGVSLIENYRSQFNEMLTNGSFDQLLEKVQKNLDEIELEDPLKPKAAAKKAAAQKK